LRSLGLGKVKLEDIVKEEAIELCEYIQEFHGKPISCGGILTIPVVNSLWRIISGEKLSPDNPTTKAIIHAVDTLLEDMSKPSAFLTLFLPKLSEFLHKFGLLNMSDGISRMYGLAESAVSINRKSYEEGFPTTFCHYYFQKMKEAENQTGYSSFKGEDGYINLENVVCDLFEGGSETTSTTLNWGILYMIKYPHIQQKVQEELEKAFGKGNCPSYSQRSQSPYTEAVFQEIFRKSSVLTFGVAHSAAEDTILGSYFIPKGTMLLPNLNALLQDEDSFPNPEEFSPERYLDADGNFKPNPKVVSFGIGYRKCIGENLARMEIYMFLTALLTHFTIENDGHSAISEETAKNFLNTPKPYKAKFVPRF